MGADAAGNEREREIHTDGEKGGKGAGVVPGGVFTQVY